MYAEPAAREAQARFSAALQAGYVILGIRAAGLAAGPMTGSAAGAWLDRLPRLDYDEVAETL